MASLFLLGCYLEKEREKEGGKVEGRKDGRKGKKKKRKTIKEETVALKKIKELS